MSTLAADLERQRRRHQAHRTERVLLALRERRRQRALAGVVPAPLDRAIAEFASQLSRLQSELPMLITPLAAGSVEPRSGLRAEAPDAR